MAHSIVLLINKEKERGKTGLEIEALAQETH
jgi:hypothetical protein